MKHFRKISAFIFGVLSLTLPMTSSAQETPSEEPKPSQDSKVPPNLPPRPKLEKPPRTENSYSTPSKKGGLTPKDLEIRIGEPDSCPACGMG